MDFCTVELPGGLQKKRGKGSLPRPVTVNSYDSPKEPYGYDLNGNAITKNDSAGITTYAWDFENRLTSVALPGTGGTVGFKYDPFGRRIYKSSSSRTSIYAYDGDTLVEETNSAGAVVARSVTSLSIGAGSVAQTYAYDSFGEQTGSTGSLTNPFQYTGRESDSETGLYYYRARCYDPNPGRFLSEDPLGLVGV